MVDARKERYDAKRTWHLLQGATTIATAKGKTVRKWDPGIDDRETILQHVIGPSGNLRAPTYRFGHEFVVGFNPELYRELVSDE